MQDNKLCQNCGLPIGLIGRSDQKYCSQRCGQNAWDKKQAEARRKNSSKPCRKCGKIFEPYYGGGRQKFCSKDCKIDHHKDIKLAIMKAERDKIPLEPRNCEFCKMQFTPERHRDKNQRFCSEECKINQHAADQKIIRKESRAKIVSTCPICCKQFTPQRRASQIYCSPYCRKAIGRRVYKMMQRCYYNTNTKKADHSHEVLGYSPNELLAHLQSFPAWNKLKHESWHLDHIFPIIAFVRKGITDMRLICALDNLQPLPGPDNCAKNDIYDQQAFDEWLTPHLNMIC